MYGADGALYQTELADFSLIISHGLTGSGPTWFEVRRKDGLIYEYGNSVDSRVLLGATVRTWALSKIKDRVGNFIAVAYANDTANHAIRPSAITYTTSPGTTGSGLFQIQFSYEARTDIQKGYVLGDLVQEPNRMAHITVATGSSYTTVVRRYDLAYTPGGTSGLSRLTTVTECSATQCLSPTTIGYQNGTAGWSSATTNASVPSTALGLVRADVNGDGIDDLVYQTTAGTWYYLLAQSSGTYLGPYSTGQTSTANGESVPLDWNGNGSKAILIASATNTWRVLQFQSVGATFAGVNTVVPYVAKSIAGDVNGDGYEDLIYIVAAGIYYRPNSGGALGAQSVLATGYTAQQLLKPTDAARSNSAHIDFNGDGREDIIFWQKQCDLDVCTMQNQYVFYWAALMSSASGGYNFLDLAVQPGIVFRPIFGDFNGDGCTDVAYGNTTVTVAYGGCTDTTTGSFPATVSTGLSTTTYTVGYAADYNGDGLADLLLYNSSTGQLGYMLANGSGFGAWTSLGAGVSASVIADTNGDGMADLVGLGASGLSYRAHNGVVPDLAASITDGFGVNVTPTYGSIAQGHYTKYTSALYPEQDTAGPVTVVTSYAASDGVGSSYSVSKDFYGARRNMAGRGLEGFSKTRTIDSRNGFQQFDLYQTASPFTGMFLQRTVYQSNGTTLVSDRTSTTSTLAAATLDSTANNQRYFPYLTSVTDKQYEYLGTLNGLQITEATSSYTYDIYGNALTTTTTTIDKDTTSPWLNQTYTALTTLTPHIDAATGTTGWCVGLPDAVTVKRTNPDGSNITRSTNFTVDATGLCRIKSQTVEPGNATLQVATVNAYTDACGNLNSVTVTGKNPDGTSMAARSTTYGYGANCIVPETITNALGQATQVGYDYSLVLPTSVTDPNGIGASQHYDSLGRVDTLTRPDATSTAITYNDCASVAGGCQNGDPASAATGINKMVVIATQKDSAGTAIRDDWTYADQFDRTIVTKSKTLTGSYSRVGTQYNAMGRILRRTAPCDSASCSVYWTTNGFDSLARLTSQQRPISASNATLQTATVSYQGRTVSYTDPQSKVTTRLTNVAGQLGRSQDHNGYRQDFSYDPFGSLVKVQDNGSPINTSPNTLFQASYVYGAGAFQTDVTDMDLDIGTAAGQHRHYSVDSLGELISLSDARGNTTTFDPYDPLGRPTKRTEPDLTTTWTWGISAASHNIGQLASVSANGPQAYSESYAYDSVGRLSNRTIQGNAFDLTYNAIGAINSLTYPTTTNSCRVKLQYGYQNGFARTITDASPSAQCTLTGTVYWTANNQNPLGQITQETLGNNVVTNRVFDNVTGWLASIQAGAGGGTALQNQSYLYDLLGNITQRQDNAAGLTESICYDNVYRLDHTTSTGLCTSPAKLQMTYDAMGNITKRSDVAANALWTYSTTHKHQVLQAGDAAHTYTFDNNGNAITRNGSGISWTSYNMPLTINSPGESSTWSYGQDHQKWLQQYSGPSGSESTTYLGDLLEKVIIGTVTDWRHYIVAGGEQVAVYSRKSTGTNTLRYTLEDHQGSPSAILASTANPTAALVKESFEPYGTRRNPATWTGPPVAGDVTTINGISRVGYTGQTMLGNMGLIHMNGRVLDSVTGRFLSADPYITEPGNTQNFNRYGYAYNNPLSYIDPSGYTLVCNGSPGDDQKVQFFVDGVTIGGAGFRHFHCEDYPTPAESPRGERTGGGGGGAPGAPAAPGTAPPQGPIDEVVVTADPCAPPAMNRSAERSYRPWESGFHFYGVYTPVGVNMSEAQKNKFFDMWRNGHNPAPGATANAPDNTPLLLAKLPGAPDTNWVYLETNLNDRSWTNYTLPGHQFYPGKVWNGLFDVAAVTFAVSIGTGVGPDSQVNMESGSAFFQASQLAALAAYLASQSGTSLNIQLGQSGSCN